MNKIQKNYTKKNTTKIENKTKDITKTKVFSLMRVVCGCMITFSTRSIISVVFYPLMFLRDGDGGGDVTWRHIHIFLHVWKNKEKNYWNKQNVWKHHLLCEIHSLTKHPTIIYAQLSRDSVRGSKCLYNYYQFCIRTRTSIVCVSEQMKFVDSFVWKEAQVAIHMHASKYSNFLLP